MTVLAPDVKEFLQAPNVAAFASVRPDGRPHVTPVWYEYDGREFSGTNVENAAYPLGVCAEKTAISAAATAGYRPGDIEAIGITASPCGGCRQWLYEWRIEDVSYRRGDGSIGQAAAGDLLPDGWDLPA